MAATSVSNLPVELLRQILEFTNSPETWKNVALCSRQLHSIATAYLFERIQLTSDGLFTRKRPSDIEAALLLFLQKPELAAYVRHLAVRPPDDNGKHSREVNIYRQPPVLLDKITGFDERIKDAIAHDYQTEDPLQWLRAGRVEDGLLAILIPRLPKLETLDLETGFPNHVKVFPKHIPTMLSRVASREKPWDKIPALTRLHSITWFYHDYLHGGEFIASPFMMKPVRHVYFHRIGSDSNMATSELQNLQPGTSACTHLEMRLCNFNDTDIQHLISVPKQLRTFIYHIGWGRGLNLEISFQAIQEGLLRQKDSLEHVWLDSICSQGQVFNTDSITPIPVRMFREFPKLKTLRILAEFLIGHEHDYEDRTPESRTRRLADALPPSIETLHIEDLNHREMAYATLEHLIMEKDVRCPELKVVKLSTAQSRQDRERLVGIEQLAKDNNLQLIILDNPWKNEFEECKWGMDENIEWLPCSNRMNLRLVLKIVNLARL